MLATDQNNPLPAILLTCSLPLPLPFSSSHFLIISLHSLSSVIPLVLCLRPPAVPAPSLTLFATRLLRSHFHPSSSLSVPFLPLSSPPTLPLSSRLPPSSPQLPRLSGGERDGRVGDKKRGRQRRCCSEAEAELSSAEGSEGLRVGVCAVPIYVEQP